jgi:hypothetical protein
MHVAWSVKHIIGWLVVMSRISWPELPIVARIIFVVGAVSAVPTIISLIIVVLIPCSYLAVRATIVVIARFAPSITISVGPVIFRWSCSFYCNMRLLHLRICQRRPCVPILFLAWFGPSPRWNLNGGAQWWKHQLLIHQRHPLLIFLWCSIIVYTSEVTRHFSVRKLLPLQWMLVACKSNKICMWTAWWACPSFWLFLWQAYLTMTMLRRWGVAVGFALLFPLSPRVFSLLADNLITMPIVPVTHRTSVGHGVAWILWVLVFCEFCEWSMVPPSWFCRLRYHMYIAGI